MGWSTASGIKGREPTWKAKEVITGDICRIDLPGRSGFPNGWKKLPPGSPELADAQAAADKPIVAPTGAARREGGQGGQAGSWRFPPPFKTTADYVRWLAIEGRRQLALHHPASTSSSSATPPHYDVLQVRPVLKQPLDPGGTPAPAVPDVRQPVTIVMVRDLGSLRFPPFV